MANLLQSLRWKFVRTIYASHNDSAPVQDAIRRCLGELQDGDIGLNVGAGTTRLHQAIINYDLLPGPAIDCTGRAERLPFADNSFSVVISQETLEHVADPFEAVREICRTMRPGGVFYCQVPFVIGYHPGPTDYWRFTKEGIQRLVEQGGLLCESVAVTVGPGTGFYRILVEFFATVLSRPFPRVYLYVKGALALFFYPVKWLDGVLYNGKQVDRIAGGYYAIARKLPSPE
ncbi:class I SAM-dependent methyltransferase [Singulisphaera sp. Ch08]|uniref:Class I SAM-dependent methyltransferase n=1 Tax=Singulisphaera sp. Ch08 TaxID=3120278 RepID=A0AAU7CM89_9BACT